MLNGAQGIGEIMNQVIGQAGPALDLARHALGSNGNGRAGHADAPADAEGRPATDARPVRSSQLGKGHDTDQLGGAGTE